MPQLSSSITPRPASGASKSQTQENRTFSTPLQLRQLQVCASNPGGGARSHHEGERLQQQHRTNRGPTDCVPRLGMRLCRCLFSSRERHASSSPPSHPLPSYGLLIKPIFTGLPTTGLGKFFSEAQGSPVVQWLISALGHIVLNE